MKTISLNVSGNDINKVIFNTSETIPDVAINMFSEWLTEYINEGAEFETDQTIQFGWSHLMVQKEQQVLKILAPDFQSMPIRWIEDLSIPLHFILKQKYVAESFLENISICNMLETAIICKDFHKQPIIMQRHAPYPPDSKHSGWYIGQFDDENEGQATHMSLYEIHLKAPLVTLFLWLPEDYEVTIINGKEFQVVYRGIPVEPEDGSFVSALIKQ